MEHSARNTNGLLKKSLKDEIFELLHKRIIAGEYAPGAWLRQQELAKQLDVSPTPVREALDLLVSNGLAERIPYRGVRIPELTPAEIIDAYVLRLLLEATVARLAAHNISPRQLDDLASIVKQTGELVTLEEMAEHRQLNKSLHRAIARASGNSLLSNSYLVASNKFPDWMLYEGMFRQSELLQFSLERELEEHKALVDAIAARDADLAARRAIEHVKSLGEELVNLVGIPEALLKKKERQIEPLIYQARGTGSSLA